MGDPVIKSYLDEILHEFPGEGMTPLYPPGYFRKRRNRCLWLKLGKNECCRKLCNEAYCSGHTEMIRRGIMPPFPCVECLVGTKNSEIICEKCSKKEGKGEWAKYWHRGLKTTKTGEM